MRGPFAALNPPLPPWKEARVWIIGASTGIGAAVAQALLERGANVVMSARNAPKLREVAGHYLVSGRASVEPLDFTEIAGRR